MATSEKFINPFTDFGFKKIFQVADLAGMNRKERQDYIIGLTEKEIIEIIQNYQNGKYPNL